MIEDQSGVYQLGIARKIFDYQKKILKKNTSDDRRRLGTRSVGDSDRCGVIDANQFTINIIPG